MLAIARGLVPAGILASVQLYQYLAGIDKVEEGDMDLLIGMYKVL